uniref:Uncharacterized protein n=1 Tax=Avena sativa TaxID=4498 RepID=A0ACD5YNB5_AVESA
MASIVSRLARAAFATRAFPLAGLGVPVGGRPAAAIRVSPAGGPKSEEEEKAKSEVAPNAATVSYNPHLPVDENALKSDEAMWAFYEYWCKYHGISRDRREMERRFKIFSNMARSVHEFNSAGGGTGKASMTRFADMTNKEKSRRRGRPR